MKDDDDVEAPVYLDGTPVPSSEVADVHAAVLSGEMEIEISDEALASMKEMGLSPDDIRNMLLSSMKKAAS